MVPCAWGESDAGAVECLGGCVWEDGDDSVDAYSGGAFVCPSPSLLDLSFSISMR